MIVIITILLLLLLYFLNFFIINSIVVSNPYIQMNEKVLKLLSQRNRSIDIVKRYLSGFCVCVCECVCVCVYVCVPSDIISVSVCVCVCVCTFWYCFFVNEWQSTLISFKPVITSQIRTHFTVKLLIILWPYSCK